jgi:hypothetical protein
MSTPVTYELSLEARNKATFATSTGRPRRPKKCLTEHIAGPFRILELLLRLIGFDHSRRNRKFARILCSRPSIASCRVMPMMPAFAVVWAREPRFLKHRFAHKCAQQNRPAPGGQQPSSNRTAASRPSFHPRHEPLRQSLRHLRCRDHTQQPRRLPERRLIPLRAHSSTRAGEMMQTFSESLFVMLYASVSV